MDVIFFFKKNQDYYYVIWTRFGTPVVTKKQFTFYGQKF